MLQVTRVTHPVLIISIIHYGLTYFFITFNEILAIEIAPLRSGLANVEANHRPLATVLELCNEAWSHTILSEHPRVLP